MDQYSYEAIRDRLNTPVNGLGNRPINTPVDDPTAGGPPVGPPATSQLPGTGCNLVNQMQAALDACCSAPNATENSLCKAAVAGDIAFQKPVSCMLDLITNYSGCGTDFTQAQKTNAYNTFADVTGIEPLNMTNVFNTLNDQANSAISYTTFYLYGPIAILMIVVVWILVGFKWLNWVVGIYFTVLIVVFLYGFSIAFRIHAQSGLRTGYNKLASDASTAQLAFQNSIAKTPQAMMAVACTLTATGGTGYWECNPGGSHPPPVCAPCAPCARTPDARTLENGNAADRPSNGDGVDIVPTGRYK